MRMDVNLKAWMGQLDDYLKTIPVINLAIPGSHDSMSYTVKPSSDVAPDCDQIVQVLAKMFGRPSRRVIHRWCITQDLSVTQQLHLGIRYFDLRISTRKDDNQLYYVHGMYGDEITANLITIKEFLESFPEEIVILDFQHFYNFTDETHKGLIELVKDVYSDKLCPLPWDIKAVTLRWMADHGYRVIVIYRNGASQSDDRFWPSVRWPTPWPQTVSTAAMLQFLTKTLSHRPRNAGLVSQCVLTPDVKFVCRHPCGCLRSRCALPCLTAALPWLRAQRAGPRGVNVVISDFVHLQNDQFSRIVIGLNDQLRNARSHQTTPS